MQRNKLVLRAAQSGNVFVFILLGVFLFGALLFTFTKSGQQGNTALTKQQAKLAAQEILATSRLVEQGFQKLLARGCSEKQISFKAPVDIWYSTGTENGASPSDKSCHLFYPEGANLTQKQIPSNYLTSSVFSAGIWPQHHQHVSDNFCYDVFLNVKYIKLDICNELNKQLANGLTAPPSEAGNDTGNDYTKYGACTVASTEPSISNSAVASMTGFCMDEGSGRYTFFYLLHKH